MLLFMYVFLLLNIVKCSQVGSTLFYKRLAQTNCWSKEDISKLRARKIFEEIIPPAVTPDNVNDHYVTETIKYFRNAFKTLESNSDKRTVFILKKVLADTIGSHMRSEILPNARFAYYAGYVSYRNVRDLHNFYNHLKLLLNTQGLGWKKSNSVPNWTNFTVEKIRVGPTYLFDPCSRLVTKRDSKSCIHIPPPKSDDHFKPTAIALPLKSGDFYSLLSPLSENILLKYYTTVSKCILRSSPDPCRHTDFVSFNNELWHWLKRDVAPRLADEKLYAAYGGILRIAAAVQGYGKGLYRRNLFDYDDGVTKWRPWKALKESYVYINTDWTPHLYVAVILSIGLAICLLQTCYSYLIGDDDGCHCKGFNKSSVSKDIAYANVDSNIPAMLPSHRSAVYYTDVKKRTKKSSSKTKSSSLGSIKTQKVYDMHENTEKLMSVIMSGNEETSEDSDDPSKASRGLNENSADSRPQRPKSPPKIETQFTQMKIDRKRPKIKTQVPMYSTSTVTNSEQTCRGVQDTNSWTGSDSSSSQSASSASSKSRCRKSRSSRDLAWARRVISKHSLHAKSTSGTEIDINSYTTPQSQK